MTNEKRNHAIEWITRELGFLRSAPALNGCEMKKEWAEQIEVFEAALEALNDHVREDTKMMDHFPDAAKMVVAKHKKILDVTCGSRTIWFDKNHPAAIYCDRRDEELYGIWKSTKKKSERTCIVHPDVIADFTKLPFADNSFQLVVFDPPHLKNVGENSWTYKKYGKLDENWPEMLRDGFRECMRVLKPDGVLIFKWAETQIPAADVWKAIGQKPLFGHHSGKKMGTFWACFMKFENEKMIPLTLGQLLRMRNNEGIQIGDGNGNIAEIGIIDAINRFSIGKSGTIYAFENYGKTWLAYGR